jgi:hypothetical protein
MTLLEDDYKKKYIVNIHLTCDPINDNRRVDKNSWTNPYLFIDYIKIYYSPDSEIVENGSQPNDSAVIKYGITGFLVLLFMSIVLFILYYYY